MTPPQTRRVVVTGLGVVAPNANGVRDFELALRKGRSGIRSVEVMAEQGFGCRVGGVPQGVDELAESSFEEDELLTMNMSHRYASLASVEAWTDAGLERPAREDDRVDWDSGTILGTGIGGMDTIAAKVVPLTDAGKVRRLGSTAVEMVMASGVSARISGQLALGNQVTTNSSACSTGTEAITLGAERIQRGLAERMLCGGAEAASHYIWAGFDSMRVLCRDFNDEPEKASRPMSATAGGFVPGAGAGVLLLESLESAQARGARIRAELLGFAVNCGGHRGGGSMTAPNPEGVRRCVRAALDASGVDPAEIDAINGHLTATGADPSEVASWAAALERTPENLPPLVATKSLIGHTLGAAGAIESVASVLMVQEGFLHPSINCEDVHPEIADYGASIPHEGRDADLRLLIKAGFGFGDVNSCLVFRRWEG
ncbi:MAG: beta-ketoacyl-[acyl-carrier-protein] synthase family protein [Proteobacteria bacterium]|nr:beta-ketoacyl-[acyl-carrier-protein] synthase family protein [Pseudomonadota bacterium]MCZ6782444.1 beta-ketoacyl-[acyl-carrier-protein] synthase family protein [Pseudomonadota bacterium]